MKKEASRNGDWECLPQFIKYHWSQTSCFIIISERLKAFPLRLGKRQGYSLWPLLLNIVLKSFSLSNFEGRQIIQIG